MTWTPSSPGRADVGGSTVNLGNTNFAQWALAATESAAPAVQQVTVINCWEMIALAAYRAGMLPWARIHAIYDRRVPAATVAKLRSADAAVRAQGGQEVGQFVDNLVVDLLTNGSLAAYDVGTKSPQPGRGDVVFFNRAAHVTLATGNGDQIYSFWPPPNTAFTSGGTVDAVKTTTIDALYGWMDTNRAALGMGPTDAIAVELGAPAW